MRDREAAAAAAPTSCLIKGRAFGAMPMTARLTAAEARKGLKLLNFKLALFLLTFLLR